MQRRTEILVESPRTFFGAWLFVLLMTPPAFSESSSSTTSEVAQTRAEESKPAAERAGDKDAQRAAEKKERDAKLAEALGRARAVGGKGSKGGGFGAMKIQDPEVMMYQHLISSKVKGSWKSPEPRVHLMAKVLVSLSPEGRITDSSIVASSGNSEFDDSVLSAVKSCDPFPPPPAKSYDLFKQVRFTFDSEE